MPGLFSAAEIAGITRGTLFSAESAHVESTAVSIDSRECREQCLFVALPGARTDGHAHLGQALANGARTLLVRRSWWEQRGAGRSEHGGEGRGESHGETRGEHLDALVSRFGAAVVAVADPLRALQELAAHHLNRFPDVAKIGVTGSNGKTTTKEIIGGILSALGETVTNEGNLNSEIGLPLSAFRVSEGCRYAVFEMGMNHPGEMDILTDIVRPQYALITNIGAAHIEFFGSTAGIAAEKKKVFKHFTGKETGFLYEGESLYRFLSEDVRGRIVPFGPTTTEGYGGSCDLGLDGMSINWEGLQIHFPLFGQHNVLNALAAITLTRTMGAHREAVKRGLEGVKPIFARSHVIRGSVTVVEDCYNANPDSMATVLRFFDSLPWDGRKIAVLGNMLELGEESRDAHLKIARLALEISVQRCFFFGEAWEEVRSVLHRCRSEDRCFWTRDFDTLLQAVVTAVKPGDLVILKGSRGAQLERLVDPLLKAAA